VKENIKSSRILYFSKWKFSKLLIYLITKVLQYMKILFKYITTKYKILIRFMYVKVVAPFANWWVNDYGHGGQIALDGYFEVQENEINFFFTSSFNYGNCIYLKKGQCLKGKAMIDFSCNFLLVHVVNVILSFLFWSYFDLTNLILLILWLHLPTLLATILSILQWQCIQL
jgi:hypothetical protein